MPVPDLTAWPTPADLYDKLDAAGIALRVKNRIDQTYWQRIIDSVTAEVTRKTHRQFIADIVDVTRYYDGSGTGSQEIDEIVSLTSVSVVGYVATSPTLLMNAVLRADNNYPNHILEIYRGSLPAISLIYLNAFPNGRQNIQVVGKFGYGATVPQDLWESVTEESASRLAAEALFDAYGGEDAADNPAVVGRMKKWADADAQEEYLFQLPGEALGWHLNFKEKVALYSRAVDRNLRRWNAVMV